MRSRDLKYQQLTSPNVPGDRIFFHTEGSGLYSYMFVEDISNHIMPFGERSYWGNKSFQVNISDSTLETEAKALFHISYGYDPFVRPLSNAVFDFIRKATGLLLVKGGKVYFEIIEATIEENEISKPVHILKPIYGRVIKIGNRYFQIIPKEVQEGKKRFISIPQEKIWMLAIPKVLGRVKDIISLSEIMTELGKASSLSSEIIANQRNFFGFDFIKFRSSIDSSILRATKKWGWEMRMGINNRYALEYYIYYRKLRFGYSMAILRDDILSKMNALLIRLGYESIMSFSGLPTPDDFLDAIEKMKHRKLSFQEVLDITSF